MNNTPNLCEEFFIGVTAEYSHGTVTFVQNHGY